MYDLDERVFTLRNLENPDRVEAIGVPMNGPTLLVGIYYPKNEWQLYNLLKETAEGFGNAEFCNHINGKIGVVAKMSIGCPFLKPLNEKLRNYHDIKTSLLEYRASNPSVFLSLFYNENNHSWDFKPVKEFSLDSNYGLVMN